MNTLDADKKYEGSCQACGCQQATTRARLMVHHGYQRPGDGYIVGDCAAVGQLPYELSCDYTKVWRDAVQARLDGFHKELADLQEGRVNEFHISNLLEIRQYDFQRLTAAEQAKWSPRYYSKRGFSSTVEKYVQHVSFTVGRDHVPSAARGEREPKTHYNGKTTPGQNFAWYLTSRVEKLQEWVRQATSTLAYLDKRIADWVYAPEKLKAYSGARPRSSSSR